MRGVLLKPLVNRDEDRPIYIRLSLLLAGFEKRKQSTVHHASGACPAVETVADREYTPDPLSTRNRRITSDGIQRAIDGQPGH